MFTNKFNPGCQVDTKNNVPLVPHVIKESEVWIYILGIDRNGSGFFFWDIFSVGKKKRGKINLDTFCENSTLGILYKW